jgi:tRNA A-37 threonylcarbamoyl transferase component Bud32
VAGQQLPLLSIAGSQKGSSILFEDHHGGLWLGAGIGGGTPGLNYFDGSRFVSPVKGVFPRMAISGLEEDSDGGIWVASDAGLFRFFQGHLEKIVNGAAWTGMVKVAPDVFLATVGKLARISSFDAELVRFTRSEGAWKAEPIMKSARQTRFQVDRSENVLYPCPGGFCEFSGAEAMRWRPGSVLRVVHHPMLGPPDPNFLGTAFRDRFGCIWMRSALGASYRCPGDLRATVLPAGIAGRGGDGIYELNDGSVVIPSFGELAIGRPGKFRVVSALNGYQGGPYSLVTADGSVWLSTGNGLFVFPSRLRMEFWTERDGLAGNTWSVLPTDKKVLAIAGDTVRLLDQDRSRWRSVAEVVAATHLLEADANTIFVSSQSNGVVQISTVGKVLRRSGAADAMMLAQTPDGQTWMAGSDISVVSVQGRRLSLASANFPGPREGGVDMKVDPGGGLWACYLGGLIHKDKSGWHLLSTKDGLLQNSCASFALDGKAGIWYGYLSGGFSLIENTHAKRLRIENFLDGGEIGNATTRFFVSDRRGWLWRGSPIGIYVADMRQARQGQWLFLNRADGLPGIDANQRSFTEDRDGSVWFGMDNSVIHLFPPDDLVHPTYAPNVFVSGFSWNGGPFQMASVVDEIEHGAEIVAHIGSLQFDRRNALRIRYRLLPGKAWSKPRRELDIALGKLPWGKHTFEVQARLYTGPWSPIASQSFIVLKPVWLSWPALLGFSLASGFAVTGSYEWRKKRRQRAQTPLPELADWRMAVLSPDAASSEGAVLDGRFAVGRIMARGGFATVFAGRDLLEDQPCAVKIFRHELSEKSWMGRRFQQEVTALKQIRHVNVVGIYGHGTTPGGAPYLAMELVEGETLRELLNRTTLERAQVASYLRQTGLALQEIHTRRICHRDLKPENLMIRQGRHPGEDLVLIDFSIAIVQDPDETLHGLSRAAGTLQYMAPEQAIGYADATSDIYSLAKILLEMLTGQRLAALLPDASLDLPARLREWLRGSELGLSESAIDLVAGALEFDPGRRPKDAGEFASRIAADLARPL